MVYKGEARIYFTSNKNRVVGIWTDLPADYAGGMVGLFMGAHQATYTSIKIADISDTATPMTNLCKFPGAVCDTNVGLCLGGPTSAPTATPTSAPTYYENCQDPFRHAASEFCPSPVGGAVTTYDTTDITAFELIDQEPISEPCNWTATADGLSQSANSWGTWPTSLQLVGCIALIPETYTDFIAEYEAVHFDNDAWGFVFGWTDTLTHYSALTHNDAWPQAAIDGISGPFTKIRKSTGLPCVSPGMDASNACYETLAYTDRDGYSDAGPSRDSGPRSKEYEYSHAYSASSIWQPHKITLIVKGQEARLLYKTPDMFMDTPFNDVRMGNQYQAAMSFDLKGYTGGRVGIMTSAHQMVASNFKITDISDPANLPTAYCGGLDGAVCDEGITGLCLAVAASGVCEGAVNPEIFDTTDISLFEFIDDPVNSACNWGFGPNGFLSQSSNANRNEGTTLGCNALLPKEYTDFVMEMWMDNLDNDGDDQCRNQNSRRLHWF